MKLQQDFTLDRPRDAVWAFFQNVPEVAKCLPGAEYLGTAEDGKHTGKMSMKVGPFQASFEGAAKVDYDDIGHSVKMEGKGVDKKGASRGKMVMECVILDEGGKTKVSVDADVQLSGAIAQFGRTGIIEEIANVLISDFVKNVETALPGPDTTATPAGATAAPAASRPISGTKLLWLSLRNWLRALFRKTR